MELTYTNQGDYRLPNLTVPEEPEVRFGKYALLRRSYLKEHRKVLFTNLLTSGKLTEHLMEIEEAAQNRMEQISMEMMKTEGVTEELKASDQMEWVRRMNYIRDSAEEIIRKELIYN
ncbi:MAG: TnpV protein [Acutalibacteraceae bacterium]|nr:TnpV protein [Ruminococcus sp.]MBS5452912.1 TnpV protein [Ruminococcus sp.]